MGRSVLLLYREKRIPAQYSGLVRKPETWAERDSNPWLAAPAAVNPTKAENMRFF